MSSKPLFPCSPRLRYLLLTDLLAQNGRLHLTRALSRALGLRRRDLRAEVDGWIATGVPMEWWARNHLIWTGRAEHIVLQATSDEVMTLISALRSVRQHAHDRSMLGDAAELLHQVMEALTPASRRRLFALAGGELSLLPPVMAADDRPGSPVRAAVLAALRDGCTLGFVYTASDGGRTAREVWPLGLTHHGACLLAFCTLRQAFRTFRIDQIAAPKIGAALPKSRDALLRDWRLFDPEGAGRWDIETGDMTGDMTGDPDAEDAC